MTAKVLTLTLALVMAAAWTTAFACPGHDHSHDGYAADDSKTAVAGYSETREAAPAYNETKQLDNDRIAEYRQTSFGEPQADGTWSGRWVAGEWTPGYWHDGAWRAAENVNGNWVARVDDNGAWVEHSLSPEDWAILEDEGAVMGYSQTRSEHVYMEGDMGHAKGDYHEGAKCGGDVRGYHRGHGGCGCDECCVEVNGWYDCWGVWQPDDYNDFAAIRESDYDPVMGRGDTGRGWFW